MSHATDGSSQPSDLIDGYHKKDAKALHVIGQVCMPWCARLLRLLIKHQAYHCVAACTVLNLTVFESLALSMGLFLLTEGVLYLSRGCFLPTGDGHYLSKVVSQGRRMQLSCHAQLQRHR